MLLGLVPSIVWIMGAAGALGDGAPPVSFAQAKTQGVRIVLRPVIAGLSPVRLIQGATARNRFTLVGAAPFKRVIASSNSTVLPPAKVTILPPDCGANANHLACFVKVTSAGVLGTAVVTLTVSDDQGSVTKKSLAVTVVPAVQTSLFGSVSESPAPKGLVVFLRKHEGSSVDELLDDGSASFVSRAVDLNDDGRPEYFVEARGALCGAANCPAWVVQKAGQAYDVILNAGSVQKIELLDSRTNGYRDIMTRQHGSATDFTEQIYKFSGSRYKSAQCVNVNYRYEDSDGEMSDHKRPRRAACD